MKKCYLFSLVVVALLVYGCNLDDEIQNTLETQSILDGAKAQNYFDDVLKLGEEVFQDSSSKIQGRAFGVFSCAAVIQINNSYNGTINGNVAAKGRITIDFGNTNVLCNGRERRGKIIITYSGKYRDPGTVVETTFDNYFVDDHQVKGVKLVENKGSNASNKLEYSIIVTNGEIVFPDGLAKITWSSNRTKVWAEGQNTQGVGQWLDDVFIHNGTSAGVSRNGTSFTTTLNNLVIKRQCLSNGGANFYPVSGTKEIKTNGGTRVIDFCGGNDNTTCGCDVDVSYKGINGNTYNLTLGG